MPKLKTKSGVKKRFSLTSRGRVRMKPAGKRHGMIKRRPKFRRKARLMTHMCDADARIVRQFMPYGEKG
ncbi:MAG: 50S ribosomal protein L35 [Alphaproteobacteria bacterium GM7ARS4]|nr:50S ribosomal protein L35 [Alphaproteobacteria bacterium GM7ARS4]